MSSLGVVGNISQDWAYYSDGRVYKTLGGAALHVALAAAQAGLRAAPVAVVGDDLTWVMDDDRFSLIDLTSVRVRSDPSCVFHLCYDAAGQLGDVECDYGVSTSLTAHALSVIGLHDQYHVCCRRPLDVPRVLARCTEKPFSLDFYVPSAAALIIETAPLLLAASFVFVNAVEFELLRAVVDVTRLPGVLVSDGPRAVKLLRNGEVAAHAVPGTTAVVEVTGAGDTLAGAFLGYRAVGHTDETALERAVRMATEFVQRPDPPLPSAEHA